MAGWRCRAAGRDSLWEVSVPFVHTSDRHRTAGGQIPAKPLGKTGVVLPILGLGGASMVGRYNGYHVALLPMEERVAMVRRAFARGIRYFDTAPAYLESEGIFGEALGDVREQVFLATKVHVTDPGEVRASVEASLEKLRTDYVDCLQIHSPVMERAGFAGAMKVHAELVKLRDEGLLRFIGLSTHVVYETVLQMINTEGFDQVLLAYGFFRKGMNMMLSDENLQWRERCLERAHELGIALVVMKVLGGRIFGHQAKKLVPGYDPEQLARLPAAAIRWVLQDERVDMLEIGVSLPSDIDNNIETLCGPHEFTDDDHDLLSRYAAEAYEAESVRKLPVI